jgi:hypothetical protein
MKPLLIPLLLLTITASAQSYGVVTGGVAMGQTYDGKTHQTASFGAQSFFFSMSGGWQSGRNNYSATPYTAHLLIEGQGMYSGAAVLAASLGAKIGAFEALIGYGDNLDVSKRPVAFKHYLAPTGTIRLVFGHMYISGQYFNGSVLFGAGFKAFIYE